PPRCARRRALPGATGSCPRSPAGPPLGAAPRHSRCSPRLNSLCCPEFTVPSGQCDLQITVPSGHVPLTTYAVDVTLTRGRARVVRQRALFAFGAGRPALLGRPGRFGGFGFGRAGLGRLVLRSPGPTVRVLGPGARGLGLAHGFRAVAGLRAASG